jgi:hypothetical protein
MSRKFVFGGSYASFAYLYNVVAFQGGFSFYKLNSTYTGNCIRVRRTSDNVESEIGFLGNFLDIATLLTFASGSSCRVVKWYSQDGSGLFASQTSFTSQPLIVNAGVMVTNPEGDYAMDFVVSGTQDCLLVFSSGALYNNKSFAMGVTVLSDTVTATRRDVWGWLTIATGMVRFSNNRNIAIAARTQIRTRRLDTDAVAALDSGTNFTAGKQVSTLVMDYANADAFIRENGVQVASSTSHGTAGSTSATNSYSVMAALDTSGIGKYSNVRPVKYISEVIFYNTDVTASVADIETNVINRY